MIPVPGTHLQTVIANGQTKSAVVDLAGGRVCAIGFPSAMTGSTMTFEAGTDPNNLSTFKEVVDEAGAAYDITITANKVVAVDTSAHALAAVRFIRLVSGTSEGAERTIDIFTK